jgi:chromosome segregation ATPase
MALSKVKTSASNSPKKWKTIAKGARDVPVERNCGCSCSDCEEFYQMFLEERAERQLNASLLQEEKNELKELIEKLERMEYEHQSALDQYSSDLEKERLRVRELEIQLEDEMRCRMENLYKKESEIQEKYAMEREIRVLTEQVVSYSGSLRSLSQQNEAMAMQLEHFNNRTSYLDRQLHSYESELANYESVNTILRQRLNQSSSEIDSMRSHTSHHYPIIEGKQEKLAKRGSGRTMLPSIRK